MVLEWLGGRSRKELVREQVDLAGRHWLEVWCNGEQTGTYAVHEFTFDALRRQVESVATLHLGQLWYLIGSDSAKPEVDHSH